MSWTKTQWSAAKVFVMWWDCLSAGGSPRVISQEYPAAFELKLAGGPRGLFIYLQLWKGETWPMGSVLDSGVWIFKRKKCPTVVKSPPFRNRCAQTYLCLYIWKWWRIILCRWGDVSEWVCVTVGNLALILHLNDLLFSTLVSGFIRNLLRVA